MIDLSVIAKIDTKGTAYEIFITEDFLYIADISSLVIVDIKDKYEWHSDKVVELK